MRPKRPSTSALLVLAGALVLAPLVGAGPAPAGPDGRSDRAAAKAVKAYRLLRRGESPDAALAALRALSAHDTEAVADVALGEFERDEYEFHGAARSLIRSFRATETLEHVLSEGLGHDDAAVRAQVIRAFGQARPSAIDWITPTEAALDDPHAVVRAAAVEALGLARAPGRIDRILALTFDESVRVRQRIPDALVRLAFRRALAPLRALATDDSWRVRLAALRALADLTSKAGVVELVDALGRETGRLREDALRELRQLTRLDFGTDVDKWRRYLKAAPSDFLDPAATAGAFRTTAPGRVEYYGLNSLSRRFVIITDCSASMSAIVPFPEDHDRDPRDSASRLTLTKKQIIAILAEVDPGVALNLVAFSGSVKRWRRTLQPMTPPRRSGALSEVRQYRADGSTNVYAALETCLDMAQESLDDPDLEDECPDTLFLLTDGQPSAGRIRSTEALLEYVTERNRDLELRIHCVELDKPGGKLMRRLAELTTGDYSSPLD